jgi:hypothetical protein
MGCVKEGLKGGGKVGFKNNNNKSNIERVSHLKMTYSSHAKSTAWANY